MLLWGVGSLGEHMNVLHPVNIRLSREASGLKLKRWPQICHETIYSWVRTHNSLYILTQSAFQKKSIHLFLDRARGQNQYLNPSMLEPISPKDFQVTLKRPFVIAPVTKVNFGLQKLCASDCVKVLCCGGMPHEWCCGWKGLK